VFFLFPNKKNNLGFLKPHSINNAKFFDHSNEGLMSESVLLLVDSLYTEAIEAVRSQKSESELLYDWRFTANQFVLAPSPFRLMTSIILSAQHLRL
jgi:hypothetical protein